MPKTITTIATTKDETVAAPEDVAAVDAKATAAQGTANNALSTAQTAKTTAEANATMVTDHEIRLADLEQWAAGFGGPTGGSGTDTETPPEPEPEPEPIPPEAPVEGLSPIPGGFLPVLSDLYATDVPTNIARVASLPALPTTGAVTVSTSAEALAALDGGARSVKLNPGTYTINLTDKTFNDVVVESANLNDRAKVDWDLLRCKGIFAYGLDLPSGARIVGSERCGVLYCHSHHNGRYNIELDTDLDSGPGCKDIWIIGNYIEGCETGIYSRRGNGIEVAENFFADLRSDLIKFAGTDVYEVRDNRNNGRWVGTGDAAHIDCFQCLNSDYHDGVIRGNFFYYDVIEGQSSGKTVQGFLLQGTNKRIAVLGNLLFLRSVHGLTTDADDSIAKWNTMISHEDADAPTMLVRMKGGGNVVSQNVDNWGEAPKDQYASLFPNATRGPNKILADFKHLGSIANKGAWELVEHGGA